MPLLRCLSRALFFIITFFFSLQILIYVALICPAMITWPLHLLVWENLVTKYVRKWTQIVKFAILSTFWPMGTKCGNWFIIFYSQVMCFSCIHVLVEKKFHETVIWTAKELRNSFWVRNGTGSGVPEKVINPFWVANTFFQYNLWFHAKKVSRNTVERPFRCVSLFFSNKRCIIYLLLEKKQRNAAKRPFHCVLRHFFA